MVTITVGGIDSRSAPSPVQRRSWTDEWGPQLAGLTAWVGNADNTSFSCTVPTQPRQTRSKESWTAI